MRIPRFRTIIGLISGPALIAGSLATFALASAGPAAAGQPVTQTLTPPPPSFETCKTVGNGFICDGARTESSGPDDTGIAVLQASDRFGIPCERLMDSAWLSPGLPAQDEAPPRSPPSGRRAWPRGSANCD